MPKLTIAEFRARLTGRPDASPLLRAYRELAGRPALAMQGPGLGGWIPWEDAPAHTAHA